jgi:hypothetical protein
MLHGVSGEVDRADIVAVDEAGALEGVVELVELVDKLAKPGGLCHAIGHGGTWPPRWSERRRAAA